MDTTLTDTQLTAMGVNVSVVDSYANGAQPVWANDAVPYTGTDQVADAYAQAASSEAGLPTVSTVAPAVSPSDIPLGGQPSQVPPREPNPAYRVQWHWNDKVGRLIYYRAGYWAGGDTGFGNAKIVGYHGLTYRASFNATRYEAPGYPVKVSGSKYVYKTTIYHVVCKGWSIFRKCRVVEARHVTAPVDYRNVGDGPFGVITTFVDGYIYAPPWARNAINR